MALDLDGTLVDSAPDLVHCLGVALGAVGLPPPGLADATRWIGDGIEMLVRRALTAGSGRAPDEAAVQTSLAEFMQAYRRQLFVRSKLYPGVSAVISTLRRSGIAVGCITNKPEALAGDLLGQAGIAPELDFIYGGDTFSEKKPNPEPLIRAAARFEVEPQQAVMVGDGSNDLESARRAGFRFVLARYGYGAAEVLADANSALSIGEISELPQLLCDQ